MMNPFLLDTESRLAHWKRFRKSLVELSAADQVKAVVKYWSLAPLGVCAYDMDCADNWPIPWDLLHYNQWCRSSIAIGMENTLRLSGVPAERMKLQLITDDLYQALLVLLVDDVYVLNYEWGSVRLLPLPDHQVIRQWQFVERKFYSV